MNLVESQAESWVASADVTDCDPLRYRCISETSFANKTNLFEEIFNKLCIMCMHTKIEYRTLIMLLIARWRYLIKAVDLFILQLF